MKSIFIQGLLSNVLNPKIALFFLAFLPQFISPTNGNSTYQMIFLGTSFALFGIIFLIILEYFSGKIGNWLLKKKGFTKYVHKITGSILIALGIRLAFIERK